MGRGIACGPVIVDDMGFYAYFVQGTYIIGGRVVMHVEIEHAMILGGHHMDVFGYCTCVERHCEPKNLDDRGDVYRYCIVPLADDISA
jgi:hypothetical protein